MSPTNEHHTPDCPACGTSIPQIPRNEANPTVSKRTCPGCRRRFQFTITWLPDRRCEVSSERIEDYDHKPRPTLSDREHTLIRMAIVNARNDSRDDPALAWEFAALLSRFPKAAPDGD